MILYVGSVGSLRIVGTLIHEQTSLKIAEREKSARMKALKTGDQACPGTASSAKLHANPDFAILFYKGLTPCHSLFDANLLRCWVPKSAIKWLRWKFPSSVLLINREPSKCVHNYCCACARCYSIACLAVLHANPLVRWPVAICKCLDVTGANKGPPPCFKKTTL